MYKLLNGDSSELMKNIPDNSIDLTVTSPPYDDMRTYNGNVEQWCHEKFKLIAQELYRITKDGGVVVWVVGDKTENGTETGTSFRQALYFKEIGFNLWDTMIFKKENGLRPSPKIPRYYPEFEYMFVLSKGKPKTFNEIRVPCAWAGKPQRTTKYETEAKRQRQIDGSMKSMSLKNPLTNDTKRKGNIWGYLVGYRNSTKDKIAFEHPAIFPEKLAEDHILSWSNENDIVFDPFTGSGTTGKMAILNNRNFIGIEIDENYYRIAKERIGECENELKDKVI